MKFKEGTVDWSEMKKAISYAVDVPESQLIFDFIGNNGNNKAYGNVRDKQSNKKYKVNIDWVENQGWKPNICTSGKINNRNVIMCLKVYSCKNS